MLFALAFLLQAQVLPVVPQDSVEKLRREARRAEAEFERLARRLVPVQLGSYGGDCDEIVGRFCLIYDSGREPEPDPEHGRVIDARRAAIEALRAAFTHLPDDFETAAPLVRYLVEDHRASEALSAARMYAVTSGDSIWGPMLTAFAAHAAGRDTLAERHIDEVLPRLAEDDRERILDIEWILEGDDRGAYRRLRPDAKREFERRFWVMADPLFLTPGNESRAEHVARHVWSRALERAPVVAGMFRWGRDLEQLTVRYGVPVGRTRTMRTAMSEGSLIEHYEPDQLAYSPVELLTRGPPPTPLPAEPWALDRERGRSGFAPVTIERMRPMPHQVTRFPTPGGTLLRVDARMVLDSAARDSVPDGATVQTGLWLLDDDLHVVASARDSATLHGDSADFAFELPAPTGSLFVYSVEALEPVSRFARRARYAVQPDSSGSAIRLSDPLVAFPWGSRPLPTHRRHPSLRPRANLVVQPTDTLGLYAEALGLTPGGAYRVRLSLEPANAPSLPSRVFSWLGRRLGISGDRTPTRLEFTAQADANGAALVALELTAASDTDGDHVIRLELTDVTTGASSVSRRIIRFSDDVNR